VNLGDGGPNGRAVLPFALPKVLVSLCCEFLGLDLGPSSVLQVG
jgi:hypothetical protein